MKLFSKKISLGMGLTVLFVVASGVYSLGYKFAMNKFNSLVSYTREKQNMYSNISEIDYNIRNLYIDSVDESALLEGMCKGYLSALDDENCKFFNREEYNSYLKDKKSLSAEIKWDNLNESTGYLYCKTLGKGAAEMFCERIDYFRSNGLKNVILDLRASYKEDMEEVFKILKSFLPEGNLVYALNKNGNKEVVCRSENKNNNDINVTILISKNSGTGAEVLASAMRDSIGAKIVGENTSGNLIREKVIEISEDLVIIFPDVKYITFREEDLYKKGLVPDESIDFSDETIKKLENEDLPYSEDEALNFAINSFDN